MYKRQVKTDDIEGSRQDFLNENAIGILRPTAEREELSVGDKVSLTIPEEGEREFIVSYIFDWTTQPPAEFFVLLENNSFFKDESLDTELYFNVVEKTPELQDKINAIVDGYPGVEIRDEDGLVEEANNQIQLLLNVIYGFLSISIFVALFGITNTCLLYTSPSPRD